ncbi:cation:dicarboxylase symporter family transporter [Herbaspirillum sp. WKF16]|jgi:aerobic C4-dicarboxylate transport protein|uniref:cation:dicarboxylate symporter family transporter n=1 Tax=Herbaspirillum sp. WKF16 TaxID=3028312 RepID=UPI0023A9C58A|nr:cation:dicarboxylase symporter family transporter [Herbaspirillum sp. WKF16]WDZ94265.1 cation:dicarboxylase symporter family transporter [Herbaspirillum sp. WKF16]
MAGRIFSNGLVQMAAAIAAGIALGQWLPDVAVQLKPLSDGFVKLIGMLIGVIMFMLVVSGIAGMQGRARAARLGGKAVLYFEAMALLSLVVGIAAGVLLQPGGGFHLDLSTDAAQAAGGELAAGYIRRAEDFRIDQFALGLIPDSFIGAFVHNNSLQILLVAVFFGVALGKLSARDERFGRLRDFLEAVLGVLFGMINIILRLAPLAAFGAMAFTIGRYGMGSMLPLLRFVGAIYLASLFFVIAVMALIARGLGVNLFRLIAYVRDELLLVIFTASSVAALPGLINKMERLGCSRSVVRLVLPAGYSFNLSGTNLYLAMATLFLAQASGVHLGPWQLATLLAIAMLTSKGATSVTGSGFIALAATLTALQLVPVGGIVLLLGVERLMKCRSLTNVIGNCLACVVIAVWEKEFDRAAMRRELGLIPD